ncbi:hypothetical protein [Halocatena marina]|uniref:Uncharacterized protein n=1 Tax=Halocatena marina TaxID=2934937 RepID=A0ABD5YPB4_9EURY|nr:hypothetical protein [Halocatena marina]
MRSGPDNANALRGDHGFGQGMQMSEGRPTLSISRRTSAISKRAIAGSAGCTADGFSERPVGGKCSQHSSHLHAVYHFV